MARRALDRLEASLVRAAGGLVRRLAARRGVIGRGARALDAELDLAYLAQILEHEDARIDEVVAAHPPSGQLRVSIVVPTHDVALAYVRELIDSVQAQSYPHWELCACDDADPRADVAAHLAALARAQPDRFRYARHDRQRGIAAATRTGIGLARGDLVAFVDADDLLHRRALEAVVSRFESDADVDAVFTDHDTATELGFRRAPVSKPGFSPELLQSVNYVNHLVVVRRDCLDRCAGAFADETSGCQDWDLALRLCDVARQVAHVPVIAYHWRARPGSLAAGAAAKPWVVEVGKAVRLRALHAIDPRLDLALALDVDGRRHYAPTLRGELQPPLELEPPAAIGTHHDVLAYVRDAIADAPDDVLVSLSQPGRRRPQGDLASVAAFAVQPAVGIVWPFRSAGLPLRYRFEPGDEALAQLTRPRASFARYSRNALAGPWHGALVRVQSLRRALVRLEQVLAEDPAFADRSAHLDSLGAALGLAAFACGLRNVVCRGMMCDLELDAARPPRALLPPSDPWA